MCDLAAIPQEVSLIKSCLVHSLLTSLDKFLAQRAEARGYVNVACDCFVTLRSMLSLQSFLL